MNAKSSLYDINKLPTDGYIILPLSMSRLGDGKGQSPEECYEIIRYFETKVSQIGVDFIFLYTNGLYYNNDESALVVRKRTNTQMIDHKNKILKLVKKDKKYIPQAMHFIPRDYVILNAPLYQECYLKLLSWKNNGLFMDAVMDGLNGRDATEANINFIIEEVVVTHLIRNKLIDFPKTLVRQDLFRLIIYPGPFLNADLFQRKNKILPIDGVSNPYNGSHYDFNKNVICNFNFV